MFFRSLLLQICYHVPMGCYQKNEFNELERIISNVGYRDGSAAEKAKIHHFLERAHTHTHWRERERERQRAFDCTLKVLLSHSFT